MGSLATRPLPAVRRALTLYLEDAQAISRRLAMDAQLPAVEKDVARWFVAQAQRVIASLETIAGRFDTNATAVGAMRAEQSRPDGRLFREDISQADWQYLLDKALVGEGPGGDLALRDILATVMAVAFLAGAESAAALLGISTAEFGIVSAFGMGTADAVAYARQMAASRVTRINDTTRADLNRMVADAVENGADWKKLGKEIADKYRDLAGPPLYPSLKFKSRAQAIAAYEIGDAYEGGQWAQMERLRGLEGVEFEKNWLNAGDSRVRPAHVANERTGWIPMDASFPGDGALRPPTDPGCRCTLTWRRVERSVKW